jgi:hypothetical protein
MAFLFRKASNMRKKKPLQYFAAAIVFILAGWSILTLYVEKQGPGKQWNLGKTHGRKVLIIFDPDPFYNLDEQVCNSFGMALAEENMNVKIATVASAEKIDVQSFDLYVYCANTYNWRPDWAVTAFIKEKLPTLPNKSTVAITLGAGSTEASQRNLETVITNSGGRLLGSYSLWLWRPNDEQKMTEPNVEVAVNMAHEWGKQIAQEIN